MSLLTLLQTAPSLPFRENWSDPDGTRWHQEWSTEGDAYVKLWDFPFGSNTISPWSGGPRWTAVYDTNTNYSPAGGIKVTRNSPLAGNGYLLNATNAVVAGTSYALSAWFYATVPTVYTFKVVPTDSVPNAIGPSLTMDFVPPVGKWFRQTMYFVAPTGSNNANIYITDDSNKTPVNGSVLYIDDIRLAPFTGGTAEYYGSGWISTPTTNASAAYYALRMDLQNGPNILDTAITVDVSTDITVEKTVAIGINGSGKYNTLDNYYSTASGRELGGGQWAKYSDQGYALLIRTVNGRTNTVDISIHGMDSGGYDNLLSSVLTIPVNTGYNRVRFERSGTILRAKMWDNINGTEPSSWQITGTTITGDTTPGIVSLSVTSDAAGNNRQAFFANLVVDTPASGGGGGGGGGTGTITPVAQVGSATTGSSATNSATVNKPTGVVAGNLLVAIISTNTDATIPAQTGWTQIDQVGSAAGALLGAFYKIAGASEPTSYTFSGTASTSTSAIIAAFTSFDTTTPFDIVDSTFTGTGTSLSLGPVTTVTDQAYVLYGAAARSASDTVTADAALTTLAQVTAQRRITVASEVKTPAGSTTARTFSGTTSVPRSGVVIAIRPVVTAAPSATGEVKWYNGTTTVPKPAKYWNGTSWVVKPVKYWNGTAWVTTKY